MPRSLLSQCGAESDKEGGTLILTIKHFNQRIPDTSPIF
jgi:hypothetical protein